MAYVQFDPEKHKGKQLYEIQTQEQGDNIESVLVKAKVLYEVASMTPWYYFVEESDQP